MVVQVNEQGQGESTGQGVPWRPGPQGCVTWKPASLQEVLVLPGSITLHRPWALVLQQEGGWAPAKKESSYSFLTPPASRGQDGVKYEMAEVSYRGHHHSRADAVLGNSPLTVETQYLGRSLQGRG